MRAAPPNSWTLRVNELSERAYQRYISGNPVALEEFASVYYRLESDPRQVGRDFRTDPDGTKHWVYESPQTSRVRMRIYYTTKAYVVTLAAIALV